MDFHPGWLPDGDLVRRCHGYDVFLVLAGNGDRRSGRHPRVGPDASSWVGRRLKWTAPSRSGHECPCRDNPVGDSPLPRGRVAGRVIVRDARGRTGSAAGCDWGPRQGRRSAGGEDVGRCAADGREGLVGIDYNCVRTGPRSVESATSIPQDWCGREIRARKPFW